MRKTLKKRATLIKVIVNKANADRAKDDREWFLRHPEYEHQPVDIITFIDSNEYLGCGKQCWDSIKNELSILFGKNYTEAVLCQAIGSGKSFSAAIITCYQIYKVLCLKDPQEYFGFAKESPICFINMSIRADQSRKVVFGAIKTLIDNSFWFNKYYKPDSSTKIELRFPKDIVVFPGNSSETFPLGYNLFGGVMDEAAWYVDTDTHDVAEDMFNALQSRINSRFGDLGLLVIISSPRYVDDFIEKKMKEAETNGRIFASRKMLWESKPLSKFSGAWVEFDGYKIPAELEPIAARNPEAFKRDYMAIPSLALEPYFKKFDLVEKSINPNLEIPVDEYGNLKPGFRFKGSIEKWHFIHVDLSHTRDATGFAMAHMEDDLVIIDLMLRIKAPPGGEIIFDNIRELIIELSKRNFYIRGITFDGWQSIDSIQILKQKFFNCEVISVDKDTAAYDTLKDVIYSKRFICYRYEPFMQEIRRLELKEGKKVDHPHLHGSKDVSDAVAAVVFNCVNNKNNFGFGFAGGTGLIQKTPAEAIKEAEILTIDNLVPYGYFRYRRPY